ncbi:50S ribosomal protein L17 [bacterium]|nr:MAG: 50S ribosomal protein L17 [bacterium]
MRHKKSRHQLNRFTSWHKATLNSMARSIIINQRINTTLAKAKAARTLIENLITLAKENTLANKRRAFRVLQDHKLVSLLFNDIGPRFKNRVGGYTRILNLGVRRGDNANIAILELSEIKKEEKKTVKPEKAKEVKPKQEKKPETLPENPQAGEKQEKKDEHVSEKPDAVKKPTKKFLGGLRGIFKKERDSL